MSLFDGLGINGVVRRVELHHSDRRDQGAHGVLDLGGKRLVLICVVMHTMRVSQPRKRVKIVIAKNRPDNVAGIPAIPADYGRDERRGFTSAVSTLDTISPLCSRVLSRSPYFTSDAFFRMTPAGSLLVMLYPRERIPSGFR